MSHQPFEKWLFAEESLNQDQQQQLDSHLQACPDCRALSDAWQEVKHTISVSEHPIPAPGFSKRWQARLAQVRQIRQQRRIWMIVLSLLGAATLILFALTAVQLLTSPWFFLVGKFFASFTLLTVRIHQFFNAAESILSALPLLIPIMIIFGMGTLSASLTLILAWINSLIRLYQPSYEGVSTQ